MLNIAQKRLHSQRLVGPGFSTPADVVRWFGAVQSQDFAAAKWGLAQRMEAATQHALDQAFDAGEFVRTHALRPTWHFVAPDDLRWILALTSPRVQAANARVYRRLELDDVVRKRARAVFSKALRDHCYLTRAELAQHLAAKKIDASGQRLAYIVMHFELDGLICSGPQRGNKHTYALVDERVPMTPVKTREEALAELARRYFTSHGPATAQDFSWWSGLTVRDAKLAAELQGSALQAATVGGKTYWFPADAETGKTAAPVVHLLPNYDEHVVAYRDHAPSLDPRAPHALKGWGNALTTHLVARNGLVVGGWRRSIGSDRVALELNLHVRLKGTEMRALERAAAGYSAFMGLPVALENTQV